MTRSAAKPESQILAEVLTAIGSRPDCRVWRANTGAAQTRTGRVVHFGLKGQADILGLVGGGRFLGIEVKSATGRLRPDQVAFGEMIRRFGGLYLVVRSAEDAVAQLETALCEPAAFHAAAEAARADPPPPGPFDPWGGYVGR